MAGPQNQYDIGLEKTAANFVALTPLSFLARTAAIYPNHTSTVYEDRRFTWSETYARCRRFASYLAGRGIGPSDTVAAMLIDRFIGERKPTHSASDSQNPWPSDGCD